MGFENGREPGEFAPHSRRVVLVQRRQQCPQSAQDIGDEFVVGGQFAQYRCEFGESGAQRRERRIVLAGVMAGHRLAEGQTVGAQFGGALTSAADIGVEFGADPV